MIDKKYIGKKYKPVVYEVGKEKIKEYANAVGDLNPLYVDDEYAKNSKYGRIIAPPLFAVVFSKDAVAQVLLDPELALNLPMLVHGEQEFEFYKIVKSNDVITTEAEIADIYSKPEKNLDFVVCKTTSRNQDGEIVCSGKYTFVIRG